MVAALRFRREVYLLINKFLNRRSFSSEKFRVGEISVYARVLQTENPQFCIFFYLFLFSYFIYTRKKIIIKTSYRDDIKYSGNTHKKKYSTYAKTRKKDERTTQ